MMKVLRIILILLGLTILVIVGIGIFGPTDINVSYSKVLKAPISSVYGHTADFKNWEKWSPWKQEDPEMVITYGDQTKGVGGSYSWVSSNNNSGKGKMEFRKVVPNDTLGMDIGIDMGDGLDWNTCDMFFKDLEGSTEVTWEFKSTGKTGFVERIFNVFLPSMLLSQYEKGLANLEKLAQDKPIAPSPNAKPKTVKMGVEEKEMEGFYYIGKRHDDINMTEQADQMQQIFGSSYGQIMGELEMAGKMDKMIQPPLALTHSYDRETTVSSFSPAMKVSEKIEVNEELQCQYIKKHMALVYMHKGSYDNLHDSYKMMIQILQSKGYTMEYPSYEIYLTDPESVPDQSKWNTQIVVPYEWLEE